MKKKQQITIHLLIKNDEKVIKTTLDQMNDLEMPVLITDIGSTDQTARICRNYGHKVTRMISKDKSKTRNEMTKTSETEWQLFLDPGDVIVKGIELIETLPELNKACSFNIIKGDVITKQTRLWKKGMLFNNPIYETLRQDSVQTDVVLLSNGTKSLDLEEIEKWAETNPVELEVYYYRSLAMLAKNDYDKFLSNAEHYIFHVNKKKISATMLRYYIALVKFGIFDDYQSALKDIFMCIEHNPLMAEFWCLIGDMYFKHQKYNKSKTFYENALIIGSRRLQLDEWPMHISKYKSYPEKQIKLITEAFSI